MKLVWNRSRIAVAVLVLSAGLAWSCGPSTSPSTDRSWGEAPRAEPEDEIALPDDGSHEFVPDGDDALVVSPESDVRVEGDTLTITPHETHDADVEVTTKSIVRGDATMPMAIASSAVDDHGAVVLERSLLRERYVAFDSHTSQQWTFDVEPEGTGPLVLRVGIEGARYRATTDEGLVLDVAGRTVLYGHGAFVSADGTRTPVRATWDDSVVLSVPADVLAASTYPATLDPTIRVETTIDTPVYGSDRAIQSHPSVASRGDGALVVWSDYRTGRSYDVFGVRTDASGARLEAGSFPIVISNGAQWRPSAASNGTDYFVIWEDHRDGGSAIYGARVEADGDVLDPVGVLLSDAGAIGYAPRIASDGANYLVVWERQDASTRSVRGTLVSAAGVASASFEIEAGVNLGVREPVVAYGGDLDPHYVVGWEDLRGGRHNIRAARVSAAGVVVDTTSIALTNDTEAHSQVAIAVNDARALVCFVSAVEVGGEPDADIDCRPLELDDGALGASFAAFSGVPLYDTPTIAVAAGGGFSVLSSSSATGGADIVVSVISAAGTYVIGPYTIEASIGTQNAPYAVTLGGNTLIVFQDERDGSTEIYARYLLANSPPTTPSYRLSTAAVRQDGVSVAWGGSGYVAVWHDARSSSGSIMGARVMADGDVVDTTALVISESLGPALEPVVAGGEGVALAVWREGGAINARRISLSDALIEADPIPLRTGSGLASPDVAWSGSRYLVAWEEYVNGNYDIFACRYFADGTPDAPPFHVSTSAARSRTPAITTDGAHFYVAWSEADGARIEATRVPGDASGAVNGSIVLASGVDGETLLEPSVSFGNGHVLVVWEARTRSGQSTIVARGIDAAGGGATLGVKRLLAADVASLHAPRVAFGGEDFLVAWERDAGAENRDLVVQRFDETGVPVLAEPTPTTLADSPFDERSASLVSAGGSRWLTGFERFDPSDMYGNVRARLRFLDSGDGCVLDVDCVSGACVDGVCCDTACGGGVTDCMACAIAAGATVNGTCGVLRASLASATTCRPITGPCDLAEQCVASTTVCPTDLFAASTLVCRETVDLCDVSENCSGASADCPPDVYYGVDDECPAGDLALSIVAPATAMKGVATSYSLAVSNVGAGPTAGLISIEHTFPAGLTSFSATSNADWSCTLSGATVTCTHSGVVGSGASLTPVVLHATSPSAPMYLSLTAQLRGVESDGNPSNDDAWAEIRVVGLDCGPLSAPAGGTVSTPNGTTEGAVATYACEDGFLRYGSHNRYCLVDGTWSGEPDTCVDVDECEVPLRCGEVPNSCTNTPGAFTCDCASGYTLSGIGPSTTCVDIDECAVDHGGCSTDPLVWCTNTSGGRTCGPCPMGYGGDGETCTDVAECASPSACGRDLSVSNVCTELVGDYACSCGSGFMPSGSGFSRTCVDVNECASGNGGCSTSPMVTCTNTVGSRTCGACPAGYSGNGVTCANVNECADMTTCGRNLSASNTCVDTAGGYTCGCATGFVATGSGLTASCVDVNECLSDSSGCSPLVTCTNTVGGRTCGACPVGYTGDGVTCTNINECSAPTACGKNLSASNTCADTAGGYTCSCAAGYVLSGSGLSATCIDVNECATSNGGCLNGSTCQNNTGSFACSCPATYTGINCQTFAPSDEAWVRVASTSSHTVAAQNVYSTRGAISVVLTRVSAGSYYLTVPHHAGGDLSRPIVAVSSTSSANTRCQWIGNGYAARSPDLLPVINCTSPNGVLTDSTFDVAIWRQTATSTALSGYAATLLTNPAATTTVHASLGYSSSGQLPTYTRLATGRYQVNFPGTTGLCTASAPTPLPIVGSAFASSGDVCVVESYTQPTASLPMSLVVACYGVSGTLKDSTFSVLILPQDTTNPSTAWVSVISNGQFLSETCTSTNSLLGSPRRTQIIVPLSGVYALSSRDFSTPAIAVGNPPVTPPYNQIALITAVGGARYCKVGFSSSSGSWTCPSTYVNTATNIYCYTIAGAASPSAFHAVRRGYLQPACP